MGANKRELTAQVRSKSVGKRRNPLKPASRAGVPLHPCLCRDVPTPPSDSPHVAVGVAVERLEQAGSGLMLAVINAAKIREGNHTF